jgi:hypothetical protein
MNAQKAFVVLALLTLPMSVLGGDGGSQGSSGDDGCIAFLSAGIRPIATDRAERFLGKVQPATARCRGSEKAVAGRPFPWVDWQHYYATADAESRAVGVFSNLALIGANDRGVTGALLDLEYQRIELIKFNLFDNSGTYEGYVQPTGPAVKQWKAMRLTSTDPNYQAVGGDRAQRCSGALIRHRNLTGICNDIDNPAMGSTGMLFARNVEFESTFPNLGKNELARNRNGDRLDLLRPDPQLISRELFTRNYPTDRNCKADYSTLSYPNDALPVETNCDYAKAPFFNVLAAFWIQFMTHDWFSHLVEGQNDVQVPVMKMGCATKLVDGREVALTREEIERLGCRPDDVIDPTLMAERSDPATFRANNRDYLTRAYRTTRNTNTAWWDASQIYGYDERSRRRVKRDSTDPARLAMVQLGSRSGGGEALGYLPVFAEGDPILPQWKGQEATAFPDNWSIGTSFYSNLFAREHNLFVEAFRQQTKRTPDADSGLRDPANPKTVIRYRDVSDDDLFECGRLVVAAEIAKIHTIEWTPQLLYDEPLFKAMNANWNGLFAGNEDLKSLLNKIVVEGLGRSKDPRDATLWYSVFASGAGIFGLGSHRYTGALWWKKDEWSIANPRDVNGGVNHFGSPFNFPEEFVTVYRLHPLVPDLIDYREWSDPNPIRSRIPVASTVRGNATPAMENRGLANWALSMGRQRLGLLTLGNHPRFLQNLSMPRLGEGKTIDVLALDLIRDRERGVPRFNEFRRQYGLRTLTSFDDFIDPSLAARASAGDAGATAQLASQRAFVAKLRTIYGQHRCDASKVITQAQVGDGHAPINDCLGHADASVVDNIEDVDTIVGWLAEFPRPHGFAISETQFQVFILNASRRLFSDRFFTSSFRPEIYSTFGVDWVDNNGPGSKMYEKGMPNGHHVEVSPLKRILLRTLPELQPELDHVVNAFDPWARDRGEYYSVKWKARPGAESDPAFAP